LRERRGIENNRVENRPEMLDEPFIFRIERASTGFGAIPPAVMK
jgi:hypothetical protein